MRIQDFFEGLLENKKAQGLSPKTIEEYRRLWQKVLLPSKVPEIEIASLKKNDVSKILITGREHGQFGGQRGVVVLRQLLRYIRDEGHNPSVNWWEITLPTAPRKAVDWLTDDEWEKVRNAFDLSTFTGLRDKAMVEVLRATGLRISEALSLDRTTINWEKKEAKMKSCKPPYEEDAIYFTEEALHWVKVFLDARNDNFAPIFTSLAGRRARPATIRRSVQTSMKNAGVEKRIYPHIFRKTFCTELLFGGVDIKSVQTLARHKSERTTLRYYTAVSKTRVKELHEKVMEAGVQPEVRVEERNGRKIIISTSNMPGLPKGIMTVTHARIMEKEEQENEKKVKNN